MPKVSVDPFAKNFIAEVKTSVIDARSNLVGFQVMLCSMKDYFLSRPASASSRDYTEQLERVRQCVIDPDQSRRCGYRISIDFLPLSGEGTYSG